MDIDAWVQEQLAKAGPLTEEQQQELRLILLRDVRPPYVRCDPPISVEVEHDDSQWYQGVALAYVGPRVTVRYTVDVGATHHLVVDAERVRRV